MPQIQKQILYSCRINAGYYVQDIDDSVFFLNNQLMKDQSHEILFKPNDYLTTADKDNKPNILEHLNNVKLSSFQYIPTSTIKYSPYIENMFVLENFAYKLHQHLVKVINSRPPCRNLPRNINVQV